MFLLYVGWFILINVVKYNIFIWIKYVFSCFFFWFFVAKLKEKTKANSVLLRCKWIKAYVDIYKSD